MSTQAQDLLNNNICSNIKKINKMKIPTNTIWHQEKHEKIFFFCFHHFISLIICFCRHLMTGVSWDLPFSMSFGPLYTWNIGNEGQQSWLTNGARLISMMNLLKIQDHFTQ